jgi:DNA-binding winged helix-turn-helix (wHTH) protein/TolB-like protein
VTEAGRFTIGGFRVDPARNVVAGPDGDVPIEPKIMDVLCLLAANRGEVLSREAIIDQVWGRAFGADESLTRAISRLRKLFGDARTPAQVIETISKRGYRLIAPVSYEDGPPAATVVDAKPRRRWVTIALASLLTLAIGGVAYLIWPARPAADENGVSVLIRPFEAMSAGRGPAARSLSDQVAVALSRASLLHIVKGGEGRGGEKAAFVVRGSVQPLGAGLRLTVEVADPVTGESLWAGNFDRPQALDTMREDELVSAVAGEIDNRLLGLAKAAIKRKPLLALRPWELTLLATWVPGTDEVFLRPHTKDATWPQRRALALDPNYAPAHASLAQALAYYALFMRGAPVEPMRREAAGHARLARALAPYDAGVLYELASYYRMIGDRAAAEAALERVIAIQPDHPVARLDLAFVRGLCAPQGGKAAATLRDALGQISPDNPVRAVALSHLADVELGRGELTAAAEAAGKSHDIVHQTWSGMTLAASLAAQGKPAAALRISRETKAEWPSLDWSRFATEMVPAWCLGGPDQPRVAAAFRRLGALEKGATRPNP